MSRARGGAHLSSSKERNIYIYILTPEKPSQVQAVGTTLSGSTVSADLIFVQDTNHALFTFPLSFRELRTVNFVLTATAATSGLTAVDFDNVAYTVETC